MADKQRWDCADSTSNKECSSLIGEARTDGFSRWCFVLICHTRLTEGGSGDRGWKGLTKRGVYWLQKQVGLSESRSSCSVRVVSVGGMLGCYCYCGAWAAKPDTGAGLANTLQIAKTWRALRPICLPVTKTPSTVASGSRCWCRGQEGGVQTTGDSTGCVIYPSYWLQGVELLMPCFQTGFVVNFM